MLKFLGLKSIKNIKYLPKFFMDPSVNFLEKFESVIYILLIVSPVDIIPEYLIGVGFIDDFLILLVFLNRILSNLEHYKENYKEGKEEVIDVDYRMKDDDESPDKKDE
jgi:uncharacterized membrane protein YkvA (DUF1232 family)